MGKRIKAQLTLQDILEGSDEFIKELSRRLGRKYEVSIEKSCDGTQINLGKKLKPGRSPKGSSRASE